MSAVYKYVASVFFAITFAFIADANGLELPPWTGATAAFGVIALVQGSEVDR